MSQSTQEEIIEVILKELAAYGDDLDLDSDLSIDLGLDSLEVLQLFISLEDRFQVQIPDSGRDGLNTVRQIADFIFAAKG